MRKYQRDPGAEVHVDTEPVYDVGTFHLADKPYRSRHVSTAMTNLFQHLKKTHRGFDSRRNVGDVLVKNANRGSGDKDLATCSTPNDFDVRADTVYAPVCLIVKISTKEFKCQANDCAHTGTCLVRHLLFGWCTVAHERMNSALQNGEANGQTPKAHSDYSDWHLLLVVAKDHAGDSRSHAKVKMKVSSENCLQSTATAVAPGLMCRCRSTAPH